MAQDDRTVGDSIDIQVSSNKYDYLKSAGVPAFDRCSSMGDGLSSMRKAGYSTCSIKPVNSTAC